MTNEQRKTRALNALLDSNTLTEAAEKAEISRRTLYNYIRYDGDFGAAYRAARDQTTLEQLEVLNSGTARATKLLMDIKPIKRKRGRNLDAHYNRNQSKRRRRQDHNGARACNWPYP